MPQLAESLVQATIGKWLKQPGEVFAAYEPICELITDKVVAELPITEAGIMREILVQEGETVAVGTVICCIESLEAASSPASMPEKLATEPLQPSVASTTTTHRQLSQRCSPAVQRLAQEHGIDLQHIKGTGLGGRLTRKDVIAAVACKEKVVMESSIPSPIASPTIKVEEEGQVGGKETWIDVTPIRHAIATKMRQSLSEIPHAWTTVEVDVTNLVQLRNTIKDEFQRKEGINLTYLAFVLKAIVNAIKDYPLMNAVWAVDKIIVKRDINLSLAVGTEDSVWTPVIKQADRKNIAGLAREIDELSRKTREGLLSLHDMQGGTFTVNNTGSFGSILSYPIINYPQAAILTFEAIVKRPVVIQEMIAIRSMANLCLSLDHRILDGVICGRFLQRVKENIESFTLDTKVY